MKGGQAYLSKGLKWVYRGVVRGAERASVPISPSGVSDLRNLILRTLNENQLLILSKVKRESRSLTSLLRKLNEEAGVPLSTLKLNARILRELNLITYGSIHEKRNAQLRPLGDFVMSLIKEEPGEATIRFGD